MNRLFEKIRTGSLALGCQVFDPDTVEMLAFCGIDFIWADMMWGSLDWSDAREIVRASKAANVGCLVRAQAEPWLPGLDKRAITDCHRILTLGVTGAVLSVSSVEEVELLVEVSKDWHRGLHVHPFTKDTYQEYKHQILAETLSIPLIEEAELFRNIEQVLNVEGLRAVWLGMSDLSRELGHPFDYDAARRLGGRGPYRRPGSEPWHCRALPTWVGNRRSSMLRSSAFCACGTTVSGWFRCGTSSTPSIEHGL